jgi:hypothetical protein
LDNKAETELKEEGGICMWRVEPVPFEQLDEGMRALMRASDEALGGSEWIQAFAHAPEIYKPFVKFYYEYIMTERAGISVKLTELVRHMVAEKNQCQL